MGYVGNIPGEKFTTINKQTLTGDGGTGYTLSQSVGNAQEIEVYVNNVRQEPGVAYTVSGTTLTMTGNVTASDTFYVIFQGKAVNTATVDNARDIRLKDGVKMFFGDGDDLQIYHDGSNSYIDEQGTGNLLINTNGGAINLKVGNTFLARFTNNGSNQLYHNGSEKLATTSSGINVTGTAVTDGLDVSGSIKLAGSYPTGSYNVALGSGALDDASLSGPYNTAIGTNALGELEGGRDNTAVGNDALKSNTSANFNTAVGSDCFESNTTGAYSVAIGYAAGSYNTTGGNSVAAGAYAMWKNTTGGAHVAIGRDALRENTTGGSNTAVGHSAMYNNTTGSENVAFGRISLYDNTTGDYNVAIGYEALRNNETSDDNVAVGYKSLYTNTSRRNVAIGRDASYYTTSGEANVAIG